MRNSICALLTSLSFLVTPSLAYSAGFFCDGTVTGVGLSSSGKVFVSYGTHPAHNICSLNTTSNGMDKDTCKGWLAVLQSAKALQAAVRVYFDTAVSGNPTSCSAIVYGQITSPYHLETL